MILYEYTLQDGTTLGYEELRNISKFYRACLVAEFVYDNYEAAESMSMNDLIEAGYEVNELITEDERYSELEHDAIIEVLQQNE